MLPTVVAEEMRQAISRFLRSAFPMATPYFQRGESAESDPQALIGGLLKTSGALFQGPYLDIKLPFRLAQEQHNPFRKLALPFRPYYHQMAAFERLVAETARSTIVATGTGSGKTECFMMPVLDDCLVRREQGIKTIVIYPMNALATDQARRFADEVAKLDTRLTVGLFVGGDNQQAESTMGPRNVITCQKTLRQNPPDILLTNYKMLDFLLIRPKDQPLWRHNRPGVLRYLVVDELHTFDGAQGTDLACLVRRLRDRLEAGPELACVGTSATMGSDSQEELLKYAANVFATEFDSDGIIGENRLTAEEYLQGFVTSEGEGEHNEVRFFHWPTRDEALMDPNRYDRLDSYLFHQARLWFPEIATGELAGLQSDQLRKRAEVSVRLGQWLHQHKAFHQLVQDCEHIRDLRELASDWRTDLGLTSLEHGQRLVMSLTSLVAAARLWDRPDHQDPDKWTKPFLYMRQQLWLRELRRMVCSVPGDGESPPVLRFADDLKDPENPLHLPLLHCRECHLGAWGGVIKKGDSHITGNLQTFYEDWFKNSPRAALFIPLDNGEASRGPEQWLCPHCHRLQGRSASGECVECSRSHLIRVWVPDILKKSSSAQQTALYSQHDCPQCDARDSMAIVGYRAATLTSVMTGRLFSTPYNNDFKLIAFSDSVQDAAHRAGFLGANTWRTVVRQAIAKWLKAQPVGMSLRDLADLVPAHWRDEIADDGRFCGLFIAPNMLWFQDYAQLTEQGRLPAGSHLAKDVSRRLSWECLMEFGRRSRIGRSLERSEVARVEFDQAALVADLTRVCGTLREEIEALRNVDDQLLQQFVHEWLHQMRQLGAVYDPAMDAYLAAKGKEYLLNRIVWLPGYGKAQRPPAAVTLGPVANNFEALLRHNRDTWSMSKLKELLGGDALMIAAEARQFFVILLDGLARAGWLVEKEAQGEPLWLLNPARILVSAVNSPQAQPHYGVTDPRRLVPSEHTGLLPRDVREKVETSFIEGHEPWDVNLLSATPTLEMGIDIGDLSSVFLCSVPPAQANYLQRIGRAGRKDGNALAVTIANGENHDLYFYQEPLEMMAGSVHTPGVFLKAIAVLERQLIAYCFDRWAASGIDESAIPGQLRKVLDSVENQRETEFPYTLLAFVGRHHEALLRRFEDLFPELETEERDYLAGFIRSDGEGSLSWKLLDRLTEKVELRKSQLKKAQQLKKALDRLKTQPEDDATREEINAVEQERSAVMSLLYALNSQAVLNFFTDEGLLPNYAFPEEGVTLNSVILRRRSKQDPKSEDAAYEKMPYSFQRPAQAALGELAPESRFYAVSHVMEIDQVDVQLSPVEIWRFCDRCQFSARVDTGDPHSACPKCGSAQWKDSGQRHTVLRLKQVYSTVDDRYGRIGDDSERREPTFFNRQVLVDIPADGQGASYRIPSETLPFGFEFLRRTVLREINFGPGGDDNHSFSVAGVVRPRKGFRICRECGKVQKKRPRKYEHNHAFTCRLRKHPEQETAEDYLDSLYLYRELNSEAIRILLPLSEVAYSDEKLYSFVAALNLGLKLYFRGDVHHLEVTSMQEPPSEGNSERIYLVIYDRIPGGTGYLKELMRAPENLFEVLELARNQLRNCACVDDVDRDGCYRCILAYRNARLMPTISRREAEELLGSILAMRDQLEAVDGLSSISTNVLVESKLEQRLIDALTTIPGATRTPMLINGKNGHLLSLPGDDGRPIAWHVEHQVMLGPEQGVALNTQVDVLLTPARAADAEQVLPIAVYTDGLQYHHDIVADDVCKRSAILLSGRYRVWTLGWDDLPAPGVLPKPQAGDLMTSQALAQQKMDSLWHQLAQRTGWILPAIHGQSNGHGGFHWLERLLRAPRKTANVLCQRSTYRGFTALSLEHAKQTSVRQKLVYELDENAPAWVRDRLELDSDAHIPGGFVDALGNSGGLLEMTVSLPLPAVQTNDPQAISDAMAIHLCFDDRQTALNDEYRDAWRAFWHACNQLQYLPGFSFSTRQAVASGRLDGLWNASESIRQSYVQEEASAAPQDEWQEVLETSLLDPEQLRQIASLGLPLPEVGLDLVNPEGEVIVDGGVVELCWPEQCWAVLTEIVDNVPSPWQVLIADDTLVSRLTELQEQGVL